MRLRKKIYISKNRYNQFFIIKYPLNYLNNRINPKKNLYKTTNLYNNKKVRMI